MSALKTTITGIVANGGACIYCGARPDFAQLPVWHLTPSDSGPARIDGKAIPTVGYVCPRCQKPDPTAPTPR